ncbi:MAG: response regulator [Leptospiraceae bacterium]|nr:response regulator [Leptospiraceae bacterium]
MEKLVLVAEDDEIIYESIESSLAREGIRTIHCKEGNSAIEFFFKNPVPIILTDLRMPGMDGKELVERLLTLHPKPVIIIQSVIDDIQLIINFMKRGVFDYIIKPYSLQELTIRVRKAFELYELIEYKIKNQTLEIESNSYKQESPVVQLENFDKLVKKILTEYHQNGNGLHLEEGMYIKLRERYNASSPVLWEVERLGFHDKIPNENNKIPTYYINYSIEGAIAKLEKYLLLKNQHVVFTPSDSLKSHFVLVETESFFIVLVELILNAIKFGKDFSSIQVQIQINHESKTLEIFIENCLTQNFYLPPSINLLFEPFYRTHIENEEKFPTSNIGFGLTLVRKIIANHKGSIQIFVKEGNESNDRMLTVRVSIPLVV